MLRAPALSAVEGAQHDNTVERVSLPVFLVILRRKMDPIRVHLVRMKKL